MRFEWLMGGMVVHDGIKVPGGVDELVVRSIVLGFEDGTGLRDVGDGALNDGEDFWVGEVGHLGWGLVEGKGFDAYFVEVGREKRKKGRRKNR
ncbi:plant intracellular Ras-group-related LRR protein 1-like [Pyrus ussuriensis x Pyrus communis]|uniref:Plant intracellular Ras-group-related LRR protein 1-like n=1 Tax=Pyrus ussuriensis x Pyrus communis TaxID=2448454 RepID=A0A5N5FM97_9ROSA|nr:plant intracellular Ras-group-related LRR protein 1-like [Pyrus ussuriensis x Pyrus communis]